MEKTRTKKHHTSQQNSKQKKDTIKKLINGVKKEEKSKRPLTLLNQSIKKPTTLLSNKQTRKIDQSIIMTINVINDASGAYKPHKCTYVPHTVSIPSITHTSPKRSTHPAQHATSIPCKQYGHLVAPPFSTMPLYMTLGRSCQYLHLQQMTNSFAIGFGGVVGLDPDPDPDPADPDPDPSAAPELLGLEK